MGPEAQPFGLWRPSFVRPHSVRVWSRQHTSKMHHLWWRCGEWGGRGRRSLLCLRAPPCPDPSGRRLWLPSIPLYIRRCLGHCERAVVHGNSWSNHISSRGTWPFPQTPPLLSPAGKRKYTVRWKQGVMKACRTPETQQPFFNNLQLHFRFVSDLFNFGPGNYQWNKTLDFLFPMLVKQRKWWSVSLKSSI